MAHISRCPECGFTMAGDRCSYCHPLPAPRQRKSKPEEVESPEIHDDKKSEAGAAMTAAPGQLQLF